MHIRLSSVERGLDAKHCPRPSCVGVNPLIFVALTASGHGCAQKMQAVIGQWLGQVGGISTCTLPWNIMQLGIARRTEDETAGRPFNLPTPSSSHTQSGIFTRQSYANSSWYLKKSNLDLHALETVMFIPRLHCVITFVQTDRQRDDFNKGAHIYLFLLLFSAPRRDDPLPRLLHACCTCLHAWAQHISPWVCVH